MITYAIVEISGRQYKILHNKELLVDYLGDVKTFECDRVLLKMEDNKLSLGNPFLRNKALFDVIGTAMPKKIRVATYKAKANTRKLRGQKPLKSKIKLSKIV